MSAHFFVGGSTEADEDGIVIGGDAQPLDDAVAADSASDGVVIIVNNKNYHIFFKKQCFLKVFKLI